MVEKEIVQLSAGIFDSDEETTRQSKVSRAIHAKGDFDWSRPSARFFGHCDSLYAQLRNSASPIPRLGFGDSDSGGDLFWKIARPYWGISSGEIIVVWVEGVGSFAALCTTLCWVPQALKIVREKRTEGISLVTQALFTFGIALWLIYGVLLNNWPILLANAVTLVLALAILILKVRYR